MIKYVNTWMIKILNTSEVYLTTVNLKKLTIKVNVKVLLKDSIEPLKKCFIKLCTVKIFLIIFFLGKAGFSWVSVLEETFIAYNSNLHSATGYAPNVIIEIFRGEDEQKYNYFFNQGNVIVQLKLVKSRD